MKKLLLTVVLASTLFVGSANAATGTITGVGILADGKVQVVLKRANGSLGYANLIGSADFIKTATAVALTAQTTSAKVFINYAGGGWNAISILPTP